MIGEGHHTCEVFTINRHHWRVRVGSIQPTVSLPMGGIFDESFFPFLLWPIDW